ncbi:hypothetical protein V1478_003305 [Vespula squamosa]|uniref:Uncharacterized protein n=1 Tax=Vespula squamosa TaxID=30214 RepID=A0ABD2BSB5_VESSQ
MTSATKFQKRKDDLREHDMLLKELRNTQRFGIVVEDRPRSSTLHVRGLLLQISPFLWDFL